MPCCQPLGPIFLSPKPPLDGVPRKVPAPVCVGSRGTQARARRHLPWDPSRRPSGQEKLVPRAEKMVPPYFEGTESISGLGLTQFQGFKGVIGRNPENMTQIGSKSWLAPSKLAKNPLTPQLSALHNFFWRAPTPPMSHTCPESLPCVCAWYQYVCFERSLKLELERKTIIKRNISQIWC